jgi:hypothetical protein
VVNHAAVSAAFGAWWLARKRLREEQSDYIARSRRVWEENQAAKPKPSPREYPRHEYPRYWEQGS